MGEHLDVGFVDMPSAAHHALPSVESLERYRARPSLLGQSVEVLEPNRKFCFGVTSGSEVSGNRWSAVGPTTEVAPSQLAKKKETPPEDHSSRADRTRTGTNLGHDVIAGQEKRRYTQKTAIITKPVLMRGPRDQSRQCQPLLLMCEFGRKVVPWVWWPAPCCTGCQTQTPSTCAK